MLRWTYDAVVVRRGVRADVQRDISVLVGFIDTVMIILNETSSFTPVEIYTSCARSTAEDRIPFLCLNQQAIINYKYFNYDTIITSVMIFFVCLLAFLTSIANRSHLRASPNNAPAHNFLTLLPLPLRLARYDVHDARACVGACVGQQLRQPVVAAVRLRPRGEGRVWHRLHH